MFSRYSSNVVAPIHWSSPRASAGLKMFEASNEPDELPAPMMVWISSMKTMISGLLLSSSRITLRRSSNCPRYLVPATIEVMSNDTIRLSQRFCGHSPWKIFIANPSTIAVLPQPGSPIIIGLFFFLRDRICAIRAISWSLPITGSSFPFSANLIRSREKLSNTGVLDWGFWSLLRRPDFSLGSISSIIVFMFCSSKVTIIVKVSNFCQNVIFNFLMVTKCQY